MRKIFIVILFCINCLQIAWAQSSGTIDEIIAVVGKEIITKSELEAEYANYAAQLKDIDNEEETRMLIFEHMLKQKLFIHQAQLDSIEFTDAEVDAQVNYKFNWRRLAAIPRSLRRPTTRPSTRSRRTCVR